MIFVDDGRVVRAFGDLRQRVVRCYVGGVEYARVTGTRTERERRRLALVRLALKSAASARVTRRG